MDGRMDGRTDRQTNRQTDIYIRLGRFLEKTETENRQEKTEKKRKIGF